MSWLYPISFSNRFPIFFLDDVWKESKYAVESKWKPKNGTLRSQARTVSFVTFSLKKIVNVVLRTYTLFQNCCSFGRLVFGCHYTLTLMVLSDHRCDFLKRPGFQIFICFDTFFSNFESTVMFSKKNYQQNVHSISPYQIYADEMDFLQVNFLF